MKSVALHNLGCKVNAYEIEVMQQNLTENGYKIVPFAPGADIYIINTCTVTNIADRKSRQMLHKAKKMNQDAIVVATGCYVQTDEKNVELDPCIDLAVGNNKKRDIVSIIEEYLKERDKTLHHTTILDIAHTEEYEEMTLHQTAEHTRAYIKIQDGCNQFCSYCIIPYARGRVRSRQAEDVLNEIRGLVAAGYREVVVTGIHLSSYGLDFISKETNDYLKVNQDIRKEAYDREYLLNLLKEIQAIEGLERIRLGSLEPRIITEHFAQELSGLSKLCPHFHLSLQSGCNETLKRMNRHYTSEEFYEKVQILRDNFDHPAITTDIITGFPGETDEEFEQTRRFAEKTRFYEMHIFKYSRRKGTVADTLPGQLTEMQKAKRSNVLLDMEKQHSKEYRSQFIGRKVSVLLEEEKEINGGHYMVGHTPHYVLVACKAGKEFSNQIVEGMVKDFLADEILVMSEEFVYPEEN